jgi:hypothetical protein
LVAPIDLFGRRVIGGIAAVRPVAAVWRRSKASLGAVRTAPGGKEMPCALTPLALPGGYGALYFVYSLSSGNIGSGRASCPAVLMWKFRSLNADALMRTLNAGRDPGKPAVPM